MATSAEVITLQRHTRISTPLECFSERASDNHLRSSARGDDIFFKIPTTCFLVSFFLPGAQERVSMIGETVNKSRVLVDNSLLELRHGGGDVACRLRRHHPHDQAVGAVRAVRGGGWGGAARAGSPHSRHSPHLRRHFTGTLPGNTAPRRPKQPGCVVQDGPQEGPRPPPTTSRTPNFSYFRTLPSFSTRALYWCSSAASDPLPPPSPSPSPHPRDVHCARLARDTTEKENRRR